MAQLRRLDGWTAGGDGSLAAFEERTANQRDPVGSSDRGWFLYGADFTCRRSEGQDLERDKRCLGGPLEGSPRVNCGQGGALVVSDGETGGGAQRDDWRYLGSSCCSLFYLPGVPSSAGVGICRREVDVAESRGLLFGGGSVASGLVQGWLPWLVRKGWKNNRDLQYPNPFF